MEKIVWKAEYSVGDELFDEHHQQLIHIINELIDTIAADSPSHKLNLVFSKLLEYAQIHFTCEEEKMEQYKYSGLGEQRQEHQCFVEKIRKMKTDCLADPVTNGEQVLHFLKDWLIKHILYSDMQYKAFFSAI